MQKVKIEEAPLEEERQRKRDLRKAAHPSDS
jgi:hypothetical protein